MCNKSIPTTAKKNVSGKPWSNHGQKDLAILAQDGKEMGVREKPRAKVLGERMGGRT